RRESVAPATTGLRSTQQLGVPAPAGRPVRPAPAQRAKKPESGANLSRLKLEPLDLGVERDPTLRLSDELRSQVATDPQQRAAAAALWTVLQKTPDDALQDAVRLKGVARDLVSLRDATRQNASAVGQMRAQVEQVRGGRDTAALLVLVLSAVLAGLLGWLGWRWYRVHQVERVGRWFEQHGESARAPLDPAAAPAHGQATSVDIPLDQPLAAAPAVAVGAAAVVAAGALRQPAAGAPAAVATAAPVAGLTFGSGSGSEFQTSRGGTVRMVGVEELIDVHDKADFFLSIGETEQAVGVLEAHVHDHVETSALAWMDLLELYHSLGKRVEYERLRSEFRERFTGQVPDFEHFDQPSASLESYSRALSRIVALWPSTRVLDVIEESIFRKPGLAGGEPFSLEAYRELVLLYHVAREMAAPEQTESQPAARSSFSDTALQPLNTLDSVHSSLETRHSQSDTLMVPPTSARIGVDIDLTAAAPQLAADPDADELEFDLPPVKSAAAAAPDLAPEGDEQPRPRAAPELRAANGSRELPPLDFDISAFDDMPKTRRKHGS
ncbi:hypothetical protein, partial [Ramlibacter sp.]|uniref:hypothetical protein n=1 Tax=Ramlibacter sp. TaxID=1917967 RepID=UPI0026309BA5